MVSVLTSLMKIAGQDLKGGKKKRKSARLQNVRLWSVALRFPFSFIRGPNLFMGEGALTILLVVGGMVAGPLHSIGENK